MASKSSHYWCCRFYYTNQRIKHSARRVKAITSIRSSAKVTTRASRLLHKLCCSNQEGPLSTNHECATSRQSTTRTSELPGSSTSLFQRWLARSYGPRVLCTQPHGCVHQGAECSSNSLRQTATVSGPRTAHGRLP
jgi:hypothetical protein